MEEKRFDSEETAATSMASRWLVVAVVVLFGVAAIAIAYGFVQQQSVRQLATENQQVSANVGQLQQQVEALTTKLTTLTTPSPSSGPAASNQTGTSEASPTANRASAKRRAAADRRLKQIQTQLAEHQKQLEATQQEVASNRAEIEGRLDSTKDELNGSIARTHEELVALEKRGERNFVEFDLNRSKTFQHVGPISVELSKADKKHQSYNVLLLVDDFKLSKKNVNLYEPIWIHETDYPQPLQLVVNKIDKNHVHGYVSAPKYKQSELASTTTPTVPANPQPEQQTTPQPQPDQPYFPN